MASRVSRRFGTRQKRAAGIGEEQDPDPNDQIPECKDLEKSLKPGQLRKIIAAVMDDEDAAVRILVNKDGSLADKKELCKKVHDGIKKISKKRKDLGRIPINKGEWGQYFDILLPSIEETEVKQWQSLRKSAGKGGKVPAAAQADFKTVQDLRAALLKPGTKLQFVYFFYPEDGSPITSLEEVQEALKAPMKSKGWSRNAKIAAGVGAGLGLTGVGVGLYTQGHRIREAWKNRKWLRSGKGEEGGKGKEKGKQEEEKA